MIDGTSGRPSLTVDRVGATLRRCLRVPEAAGDRSRLGVELPVDSLDVVDALYWLEVGLGVDLPLEEAWAGLTIGELTAAIMERVAQPDAG